MDRIRQPRILHEPNSDADAEFNARMQEGWRADDAAEEAMTDGERMARAAFLRMQQLPGGRMPNVLMFIPGGTLDEMEKARRK
jgi:hypothetical protein